MQIFELDKQPIFMGGDGTKLRELFHPDHDPVAVRYSLAHASLGPGQRSDPHRLKTVEVYYMLTGLGRMHIDDHIREVGPHQAVYIPGGALQWIENIGQEELTFLCMVDPAWRKEDEEVLPSLA